MPMVDDLSQRTHHRKRTINPDQALKSPHSVVKTSVSHNYVGRTRVLLMRLFAAVSESPRRTGSNARVRSAGSVPNQPQPKTLVVPMTQIWLLGLGLITVVLSVLLRLIFLDTLQNEIYNDIAIIYRYVERIQDGEWPTGFVLSAGPLYHYLIMPVMGLTGLNYFGLKLASVFVSLGVLLATYLLSRRLVDDFFAVVATFVAGVSSWLLIFSRLGNSQILIPLLTAGALWLAVRVAQEDRRRDIIACAVVSALGLYTYPQSFILPGVILLTLLCLRWTGHTIRWNNLVLFAVVTCVCAAPFVWIVTQDLENFTSGYVGGKIQASDSPVVVLFINLINALLAFHVRGDEVFRSNPVELPHLDWISGVLFLLGIIFWLHPRRVRWSPVLLVPFLLLQVPSMLVLSKPDEIPSASRTLGVAPIAYILVASGLWMIIRAPYTRGWQHLRTGVVGLLLVAIALLNSTRYFDTYINNLPYYNTPLGREIAEYVNSLSSDTQVYLVGQEWEEKLPETWSVEFAMTRPENFHHIEPGDVTCAQLLDVKQPAVMIWSFHEDLPGQSMGICQEWLPTQSYYSDKGLPMFNAAPVRPDIVQVSQ